MPTNRGGGIRGGPGVLAIPGRRFGAPKLTTLSTKPFRSRPFDAVTRLIVGVTRDSTGVALGGCTVQMFRSTDDAYMGETVSDGSGNYTLTSPGNFNLYLVAYKTGAPDLAGTTVNTLLGV